MSRLEHYMAFMKLPPELQLRINNYYQARYGGKWFNEKDVMGTVSSALKEVGQQENTTQICIHSFCFFIFTLSCSENNQPRLLKCKFPNF